MTRISEIPYTAVELQDDDLFEVELPRLGGIGGKFTFATQKNQIWQDFMPQIQAFVDNEGDRLAGVLFNEMTIEINKLRDELNAEINDLKVEVDGLKADIKEERIGKFGILGYNNLDKNMLPCSGGIFDVVTYQDLFNKIGHMWSGGIEPASGKFKLPNLSDNTLYGATTTNPAGTYQEDAMQKVTGAMSVLMRTGPDGNPITTTGPYKVQEVWNRFVATATTGSLTWAEVKLGFDNSLVARTADKNIAANARVKFGIYYK